MTLYPASASTGTWWRHNRPESGKPWSRRTGGPSPVTSNSISTPPLSMCIRALLPPDGPSALVAGGEVQLDRTGGGGSGRRRPAGGDRLQPGVEADALHAVDVGVAEQRLLPPAERVVGHGYRDGDVDPDHPDLHVATEPPGGTPVPGEDRRTVAVGIGVHQVDGLVEGIDPEHRQHRAEDLVPVDLHRRRHPIDQAGPEEEPGIAAGDLDLPAVHHDVGSFG